MSTRSSSPLAGTVLLPLLAVVACGGGGSAGPVPSTGSGATPGPATSAVGAPNGAEPAAAAAASSDLDGLTIRRVGLVRFDVGRETTFPLPEVGYGDPSAADAGAPVRAVTDATAAFTTLDEPLDAATLSRIAALPDAGALEGCYPVEGENARSIGSLIDSLGVPSFAGEVITVSNAAGSWFELLGVDDGTEDPYYEVRVEMSASPALPYFAPFTGIEGTVARGTTVDVPGDAFPAFPGAEVPAMGTLSDVVEGPTEVRWLAGDDPAVPVVVDVRFADYVEIAAVEGGGDGSPHDEDILTDADIRTLVEAPVDLRCVTRDTGRFVYPEGVRATIEGFANAGRAVAERLAPGSDIGDGAGDDVDEIVVEQGTFVRTSRVATRYRVEGDALLIVQSGNGGTL